MSKATPRPWKVSALYSPNQCEFIEVLSNVGKEIVRVHTDNFNSAIDRKEAIANAELIVRSVNSHDKLVEALQVAKDEIIARLIKDANSQKMTREQREDFIADSVTLEQINDALKLAKP